MKGVLRTLFALVSGCAFLLGTEIGSAATAQPPRRAIYAGNPYVSIGALRLDVTKGVEKQIPAGWRHGDLAPLDSRPDPYRLVKFSGPVGSRERVRLAAAGWSVVSYHPFNAFLVRPQPDQQQAALSSLAGVTWTGPFHPYFKLADTIAAALQAGDASRLVVAEAGWGLRFNVRLHEDDARSAVEAALASAPGVTRIVPVRTLPIFRVQVEPAHFVAFVRSVAALPEVAVIARWFPVEDLNDENAQAGQSGNCVIDGVEAPNTPIFNHGLTGWNARLAVAESCVDVNSGYWYDDALGRLPAHESAAPWMSVEPDWSQRKLIEYYNMGGQNTAMGCSAADNDHGSHVAGTMIGNCGLDAEGLATATDPANSDGDHDGMAPGAYLIVQADHFSFLGPGTLGDLFDLAFENTCADKKLGADCGIDAHSNSWGSGTGSYNDNSSSADASLWERGRGLIVAAAGNGGGFGSVVSPADAKNVVAVGMGEECSKDVVDDLSSGGPTIDGRLKPDVVACGREVTSVDNDANSDNANGGCLVKNSSGTSMATPTVSGLSTLVLQYFNDGFHPSGAATPFDTLEPSGPLMKAMLVNTAQRMTDPQSEENGVSWPNMEQGWGFVVLENALYFSGDSRKLWLHDETVGVDVSGSSSMTFKRRVTASSEPLKVTLVWYDVEHAGACGPGVPCLDNDLDLTVTEPTSGDSWTTTLVSGTMGHLVPRTVVPQLPVGIGQTTTNNGPDDLNTVEQIIIYDPTPDRIYEFTVTAANTPDGPIPFALVATGALADPCTAPAGAAPIATADVDGCENDGVEITWQQDVANWNDGGSGTRHYRVWRDGLPLRDGSCAGNLAFGTTSCVDDTGPVAFPADYRVEYVGGCGATTRTVEVAGTDDVAFLVDVTPDLPAVCPDNGIVLTAGVEPPGAYGYQWTEDGVDLAGETSSTLTMTEGVVASHDYNCRVTDPSSCVRQDLTAASATWLPAQLEYDPLSVPFLSLEKLCGDADASVEPGEIWSFDVGMINHGVCLASDVTADLAVNASSPVAAEICHAHGEFGDLAPQASATDSFSFKVSQIATCPANLVFDLVNIGWGDGGPTNDILAFNVNTSGSCNVTTTCNCAAMVVGEVSPTGGVPLTVTRNGALVDLKFQRVTGATRYNVYVSTAASTLPFAVTDPAVGKKSCAVPWQSQLGGTGVSNGFDVEAGIAAGQDVYYILMTADKGPTTEGTLGLTSDATEREADARCAN